jgi:hypothetical protein
MMSKIIRIIEEEFDEDLVVMTLVDKMVCPCIARIVHVSKMA